MTKRKIIITLVVVFVLMGFFLFLRKDQQPKLPPPVMPSPITSDFEGELDFSLNVRENDFRFPEELPLVNTVLQPLTREYAMSVAESLGFEGEPSEFSGANEGLRYIWTSSEASLIVIPKTSTVKYFLNSPSPPVVANKQLSDSAIIEIASDFLENLALPGNNGLEPVSVVPYASVDLHDGFRETTKENASVFEVPFSLVIAGREILTAKPSRPLVFVQVLPDGRVYSSQATLFQKAEPSTGLYEIKSFREFSSSLSSSILIGVLGGFVNLPDLTEDALLSVQIDSVSLVYLYDEGETTTLHPVFLLGGPATAPGTEADRAIFYLPALKGL